MISFLSIIPFFGLGRRDISDRFEQPAIVEPIDPFQGGELDGFEVSPGSASMGVNTHIFPGRRNSTKLKDHAAVAAPFNPPPIQFERPMLLSLIHI